MSMLQLLGEIEARGLSISATGADLRLHGPRERMDPELVDRIKACKPDLIAHLSQSGPAGSPLTPLQRSYLLGRGDLFEFGEVASHVYHEIEGVWDLDRLETALRSVVERHTALRTWFRSESEQVVDPAAVVEITRNDLRGIPEPVQAERLAQSREQRSHQILPAERAPLLAVEVTVLADDRMLLQVGHDGLVMDGISMFLFFRAWWAAYTDSGDGPVETEMPFEVYLDELATARERKPAKRSREYWLARLDDLSSHPELPLAVAPASIRRPRFSQRQVRLDEASWTALKARAGRAGLTPSGLLLAGYAQTLAGWGAGPRFTLITTVADRPPIHPRMASAIGNFSDTLLVDVTVDPALGFEQRARDIQTQLRRDLDARHFSGIEVMREIARGRGGLGAARFPFTFNSAIGHPEPGVDGSALELFGPEVFSVSQTPQVWLNVFAMEQHGGLVVQLDAVEELFPAGLVDALAAGYHRLLIALLKESSWKQVDFELLPEDQRARRRRANDTGRSLPERLAHEAFLERARSGPEAPAVITGTTSLSYGELLRQARHAAAWLHERGVRRDEPVALVMSRGPEQVVGILATLLAGGAYLPIDAGLPAERLEYLLRDGQVRYVLSNSGWQDHGGQVRAGADRQVLALDASQPPSGPAGEVEPLADRSPDDLAYVLYTSGTTGRPKGVMISHRSVLNVVTDCTRRFAIGPHDRFFGISAFTFDLSVYDVFGALSAGAAIVLPDQDRTADPTHWLELCGQAGVTLWNSVPAIVGLLHDQVEAEGPAAVQALASLRLVMMSGDRIPPALPAALLKLKPDLEIVSLGGPTETTIWNILHPIGPDDDGSRSVPYGQPNTNNRAYVLDAAGLDAPDWVTGEIAAAGLGLARGYWGDQARTAERFRWDQRRGERIYRTGDLGRYLPDGSIAILGRNDFQIKVNGYRIEAGEVETRLVALEGVRQAAVVRQDGVRGDRLVAHLVAEDGNRPTEQQIRQALRHQLPEYMVPSALIWHPVLPLTANGKVDRNTLTDIGPAPQPAAAGAPSPQPQGPSELEREVALVWAGVLRSESVDITSTLNEVGGDSLTAARILVDVRKRFGVTISLDRFPEVETVRLMAAGIVAAQDGESPR